MLKQLPSARFTVHALLCGVALAVATSRRAGVAASQGSVDAVIEDANLHATLEFSPCAEDRTLDCGTLMVPIDYAQPHGATVGIAVIRARATKPSLRIGILVGNPGGPGISGVDFLLSVAHAPVLSRLREAFDIVSFDPRGVGRSGEIRCDFAAPPEPSLSDDAALAEFFDELGRRHAQACLDQNGPFVTHIGTMNVARDIDAIRRALGESQISYAAGSYGSLLGATYASLFPRRVRAMMLDGAVSPAFDDFHVEFWSTFAQGFELTFQRFDQLCRRDPDCRLKDSGAVAAMDDMLAQLAAASVSGPNGLLLTVARLRSIMSILIGSERNWPLMMDALANAQSGDYTILFQLLPAVIGGSTAPSFPIWCNDHGTRRRASDYLRADEAVGALYPRFFGRFFVAEGVALCASWPDADPPQIRNVAREIATPILIVANDFDPNTPLVDARNLAYALGMDKSLLRYEGGGHTAFFKGITCIDQAIETYLIDRQLPLPAYTCPAQPVSFAAAARLSIGRSAAAQIDTGFWLSTPTRLPVIQQR
jgi:pimeloyl-ACP methyl ester carboxylesterase